MALPFGDRRLFVHPPHGRIGISAAAGRRAESSPSASGIEPQDPGTRRRRVARIALLVGGDDTGWQASAAKLRQHLDEDGRLAAGCVAGAQGMSSFDPFSVAVLLGRPELSRVGRLQLETYCRQGGALVALGSAGRALPDWPAFAEAVLGGWDEGPGSNPVLLEVEPAEQSWWHPVLDGVGAFGASGDPRGPVWLARGAEILLWGYGGGLRKPLAWAWRPRGGRVFYSLLGRPDDFQLPDFLRLVANAVRWAAASGPV